MAPNEFVLDVLGAQVMVEFTGRAQKHAVTVMEPWSRCMVSRPNDTRDIPRIRMVSGNAPGVADRLTRQVTLRAIEQQRDRLLMFHAGAVCRGDRAIAFLAPSGGGKTTATRVLAGRYGYLSDETTAVDADFHVHGFPKPLSVIESAGAEPTGPWKRQLSPDSAGLAVPTYRRPTLQHLLVLDRRPGIASPYLTELDPVAALTTIAPQISYLSALPRPLHRLAALIEHCGGVRRISYTEAADLLPVVDELLRTDPSATDPAATDPAAPRPAGKPVGRAADQLEIGSRIAVVVDNRLLILDGVGAAVWRALGRSADLTTIVDAVIDELGRPADGSDPSRIVRAAVEELTAAGLIERANAGVPRGAAS